MDKQPLISIIVPVYNVEKYLGKCIDSIINQTYKNIEIILVDDGSTDNSLSICRDYEKCDKRIKVFAQKNKGAAAARNKGLDNATGDYIGFVDSDDYIDSDMYEVLIRPLLEGVADVSQIRPRRVTDDGTILNEAVITKNRFDQDKIYDKDEALEFFILQHHSLWSNLYKSSQFSGVRIPENMSGEDIAVVIPLYMKVDKIIRLNKYKYNYRFNMNSVTNSGIDQRALNLLGEFERQYQLYKTDVFLAEILIARIYLQIRSIINVCILKSSELLYGEEYFYRQKLENYMCEFRKCKYISKKQISEVVLYLRCRFLYKLLLIIKRRIKKSKPYAK